MLEYRSGIPAGARNSAESWANRDSPRRSLPDNVKLASFEAIAGALADADVRYLVEGQPQDRIDIDDLRDRLPLRGYIV